MSADRRVRLTVAGDPDEHLRAALSAVAERQSLEALRTGVAEDLRAANKRVATLQKSLAKEQADVEYLKTGIVGFLQSLAMTDEMSKEQRDVVEAAARLREALAVKDVLLERIAEIDRRLAVRSGEELARAVAEARAAKEVQLATVGQGTAAELVELGIRLEAIDIELVPLTDAIAAGDAARRVLGEIVVALVNAQTFPRTVARQQLDDAKDSIGDAEAAVAVFYRAVDQLPPPDDASPRFADRIEPGDRAPFADAWIHDVFTAKDQATRIGEARASLDVRIARLDAVLEAVRARHRDVAQRRLAFEHQRKRVIDAAART